MASENTDLNVSVGGPQPQVYDGRIRPAHPRDRAWLIRLSVRLHESGRFPWRSRDSIDRAVALSLEQVLAEPSSDADIRVAEDACGEPLGFVHLQTAADFTGEIHARISVVGSAAVAALDSPCCERLSCGQRNGSIGS